jgi:hypothetical protein
MIIYIYVFLINCISPIEAEGLPIFTSRCIYIYIYIYIDEY